MNQSQLGNEKWTVTKSSTEGVKMLTHAHVHCVSNVRTCVRVRTSTSTPRTSHVASHAEEERKLATSHPRCSLQSRNRGRYSWLANAKPDTRDEPSSNVMNV